MNGRLLLLTLLAVVLSGCTNPDAVYREDAAHTFRTNLVAETEQALAEAGGVLTLSNALELAESAYGEAMSDILLRQAVGIDVVVQNML